MRTWLASSLVVAGLILAGCDGNQARELLETAQFEEKQNNRPHAKELYQEILAKYPDSEAAVKAKERLAALSEPH